MRAHVCVCLCVGRRTPLVPPPPPIFVDETLVSQKKKNVKRLISERKPTYYHITCLPVYQITRLPDYQWSQDNHVNIT